LRRRRGLLSRLWAAALLVCTVIGMGDAVDPAHPQVAAKTMLEIAFGGGAGLACLAAVGQVDGNAWTKAFLAKLPSIGNWNVVGPSRCYGAWSRVAGSYCPRGASEPTPCPGGHYCGPTPSELFGPKCPAGTFCKERSSEPQPCPADHYCEKGTAMPIWCESIPGKYCPALTRSRKQAPCPPGKYCNDGELSRCPAGHYCPEGSASPIPCDAGNATPNPVRVGRMPCDAPASSLKVCTFHPLSSLISGHHRARLFLRNRELCHGGVPGGLLLSRTNSEAGGMQPGGILPRWQQAAASMPCGEVLPAGQDDVRCVSALPLPAWPLLQGVERGPGEVHGGALLHGG